MDEEMSVSRTKKKPATQAQIGKELKQIYEADEISVGPQGGTIVPADKRRHWPTAVIVAVALFALAGVTWAGIGRFRKQASYGNDVKITVDGPAAPRAGEAGTWTVRYENDESLPLASAQISVQLPPSLAIISAEPALPDAKSPVWPVGAVSPGGSGSIKIKARALDAVDAPLAIQAVLTYRPANFNADFQKVGSWSSRVADSAVTAELSAPDESVPGDAADFRLTVARRSDLTADAALPDLSIRFDPDQLLVVKSASPAFSSDGQRTWVSAAPGDQPLVFAVSGSFASGVSGDARIRAEVGTHDANGNFISLASASSAVSVAPGDLSLAVIRNGSMADSTVGLGGSLHVSIDYQNQSQKPIADAEISLTAAGSPSSGGTGPIDWSTLSDLRGGKRSGSTITWTKKEIPDLGSIAPGAKGSIDLSFKSAGTVFNADDRRYEIDLSARGLIGSIGGKKSGKTVATPVMRTLINSDAAVAAAAKQTDGPLPPKAGQTTSYRLVWVITNALHEISGVRVTAALPAGADFGAAGNVDTGTLRYDPTSRAVTWSMPKLPTVAKSFSADFSVSVTPSAADAGKTMPLIGETDFSATDTVTGATLSSSAQAIGSGDIENGPDGSGAVAP